VHRVGDHDMLNTLSLCLAYEHETFLGGGVPRSEHETMFGNRGDDRFRGRQQLAVLRDADERTILLGKTDLILGVKGGHPHQLAARTSRRSHVLNCSRIHPANREIQIDAAKYFDPWYLFANDVSESGGVLVMVLQHDGAHPVRSRLLRGFDAVNG